MSLAIYKLKETSFKNDCLTWYLKKITFSIDDPEIEEILIDDEVMGSQNKSTKIETPKQEVIFTSQRVNTRKPPEQIK